jgi:hypothetical protein
MCCVVCVLCVYLQNRLDLEVEVEEVVLVNLRLLIHTLKRQSPSPLV